MAENRRLRATAVTPGGNAELIGVKPDDILEEMGGIVLYSSAALDAAISRNTQGATLAINRNGEQLRLNVPPGRMGIEVIDIDFDPELYFSEREIYRRIGNMIVTTAPSIEGYKITQNIDVISAECVYGLNVFKDFFMGMTDFFGGRSKTAQTALRDARKSCLYELKKEAAELGANAVIGIDLDYSEFSGKGNSMLFLVASGTAVFVEPNN